jgi:hypothetical protein
VFCVATSSLACQLKKTARIGGRSRNLKLNNLLPIESSYKLALCLLRGVVVQEGREQAAEESKRRRQRDERGSLPEPPRLGDLSQVVQEHQAQGATEHVAEEVEPEVELPQQPEAVDLLLRFLRDAAVSVLALGGRHVDDDAIVGAEVVDPVLPLGLPYPVEALPDPERQRDEHGGGQQHGEADHVLPRRQPAAGRGGADAANHGAGPRGERDGEHDEECRVRAGPRLALARDREVHRPERRRHRDGDEHGHDGIEEEVGLGLGGGLVAGYGVRQAGVDLGAEAEVAGGEAHGDAAAAAAEVADAEEVADGVDPADAVPGQGGEQEQVPVAEGGAVEEEVLDPVADEAEGCADQGHEPQRQVQRRHPGEPAEELARVGREGQEVELHLRDVLQVLELRRVDGEVRVGPVDGLQPDAPDEAQPVGRGRGRHGEGGRERSRVPLRGACCCHFT